MDLIPESPETEVGTSKEDRLTLISMNQSKRLVDDHYQLALPTMETWSTKSRQQSNHSGV